VRRAHASRASAGLTAADLATWGHRAIFTDAMRERGWVEGANYLFVPISDEGRLDRLPAVATELVRRRPDLILCSDTPPAAALLKATADIPIVFMGAADPVRSGFVASLARPGGNVTGLGGLGPRSASARTWSAPGSCCPTAGATSTRCAGCRASSTAS
jgi:hypothetical protein